MYQDFKETHPDFKCSQEVYRLDVRALNISFAKLGEEGCEICDQFKQNKNTHGHVVDIDALLDNLDQTNPDCELCSTWVSHMESAIVCRKHYRDVQQW